MRIEKSLISIAVFPFQDWVEKSRKRVLISLFDRLGISMIEQKIKKSLKIILAGGSSSFAKKL